MRLTALLALAAALAGAVLLHQAGAADRLAWWAVQQQRDLQAALAGHLAALRAGEPAALAGLVAACATYGLVHAAGPGHGKALVAGAALGTRASALRMALIAVAGSIAQAAVAVAVVYGGLALLQASARGTVGAAETWLDRTGAAAAALIGLWLLLRGGRRLLVGSPPGACGHAHGPAIPAAAPPGAGATLALFAGIAARPCSGALVVLVVAWSMGVPAAGALGVLAMGLGTAAITATAALVAVLGRDATLVALGPGRLGRRLVPVLEIGGGGLILAAGASLLAGGGAAG